MIWVIVLFTIALILAVIAGVAFCQDEIVAGIVVTIFSILLVIGGALALTTHYNGDIGSVYSLDSASIYRVYGRIETEKGPVLILSNGKQKIRAVWAGETGCPENAKYVCIVDWGKIVPVETAVKSPAETATTQPKW